MTWYVIDGMDGTGKTTVAEEMKTILESKGHKVLLIEHPDKNKIVGRLESRFLQSDSGNIAKILTTVTFIGDVLGSLTNRWLLDAEYDDFIFVRYIMSVAYLPDAFALKAYGFISRILPMPENRILVDVNVDVAMDRIDNRGDKTELFENRDDLSRTRHMMNELSKDSWIVIDNSDSRDHLKEKLNLIIDSNL